VQTVKLDKKGRVMIPKALRDKAQLKEGSHVRVKADGRKIVIEPLGPIADKYFGTFKITRWPEDLDEFVAKVMGEWWTQKAT
jgi:AbrB family looped-hinge helix DNA binding protein